MRKTPFFVYDYEMEHHDNGKSSTRPRVTVAIVPRVSRTDRDRVIGFGVGFSICSKLDNPCKRAGRKAALRRAASAIVQNDHVPPIHVDRLAGHHTISGFYVPAGGPTDLPVDPELAGPYDFLSGPGARKLEGVLEAALKQVS